MAKRTKKVQVKKDDKTQKVVKQEVTTSNGDQTVKDKNRGKDGKFVTGNKANTGGLQVNPQNIDKTGAGQRSVYNKNLLQEMLLLPMNDEAVKQFDSLKKFFPQHFQGTEEKNWQFFMELQQLNLVFHKNPVVQQRAMQEIRDRLEGKAIQRVEAKVQTKESQESFLGQFHNKKIVEPKE